MKNKKYFSLMLIMIMMILINSVNAIAMSTNTQYRMKNIIEELSLITSHQVKNSLTKFTDMENHWGKDAVGKLTVLGIIGGYPDGSFKPNQNIQVDEFIKLTVTAMGYQPGMGNGYWAEPFIQIAKDERLIGANEFTNYRRPITRQEMAKIITLATLSKEEAPESNYLGYLRGQIKDYSKIADQYKQHALTAYGMGLIGGYPDGTFKGTNNSTRAEASVVIMRFLDQEIRNKIKVDERDTITLRNNMTGEMITVYPPTCNPEAIRIANALKRGAAKSKGYAGPTFNGFASSIFSNLFEKEEHRMSADPRLTFGSIIVRTSDDIALQLVPYSIIIYNINETKKLHNEVIKEVLRELFERDGEKAIEEYENHLDLALADNNGFRREVILNDRTLSFFKDGAGKQLSLSISIKGFRYKD